MRSHRLRHRKRKNPLLHLLPLLLLYAVFIACNSNEQSKRAGQPAAETISTPVQTAAAPPLETVSPEPSPSPSEAMELPPPRLEEVREVLARVYKDAVTLDATRPEGYLVGDFNGDDSQDIAIIVHPAKEKLDELNSEFALWIVEDPRLVVLPDPHKSVQKLPPIPDPVKVQPDKQLLTIIHGHKKEGWRNPEARQSYLLDNAVGSSLTAASLKDSQGASRNQSGLSISGDVIKETLAGEQGFLYWTGAKYAWHGSQ